MSRHVHMQENPLLAALENQGGARASTGLSAGILSSMEIPVDTASDAEVVDFIEARFDQIDRRADARRERIEERRAHSRGLLGERLRVMSEAAGGGSSNIRRLSSVSENPVRTAEAADVIPVRVMLPPARSSSVQSLEEINPREVSVPPELNSVNLQVNDVVVQLRAALAQEQAARLAVETRLRLAEERLSTTQKTLADLRAATGVSLRALPVAGIFRMDARAAAGAPAVAAAAAPVVPLAAAAENMPPRAAPAALPAESGRAEATARAVGERSALIAEIRR